MYFELICTIIASGVSYTLCIILYREWYKRDMLGINSFLTKFLKVFYYLFATIALSPFVLLFMTHILDFKKWIVSCFAFIIPLLLFILKNKLFPKDSNVLKLILISVFGYILLFLFSVWFFKPDIFNELRQLINYK